MSYDGLRARFEAFKTVVSETLHTVELHHLASDELTVRSLRDRLIDYIITATELQRALRDLRPGAEGENGLHAALEERRLEASATEALDRLVMAVKIQLEAIQAVERMKRNEAVARGAVGLLLESVVDG